MPPYGLIWPDKPRAWEWFKFLDGAKTNVGEKRVLDSNDLGHLLVKSARKRGDKYHTLYQKLITAC